MKSTFMILQVALPGRFAFWSPAHSATLVFSGKLATGGSVVKSIFFLIRLPVAIFTLPFVIALAIFMGALLLIINVFVFIRGILKFPFVFLSAAMSNDPDELKFHARYNLVFGFDLDWTYPITGWWKFLIGER